MPGFWLGKIIHQLIDLHIQIQLKKCYNLKEKKIYECTLIKLRVNLT